jgi:hypothetical protein
VTPIAAICGTAPILAATSSTSSSRFVAEATSSAM